MKGTGLDGVGCGKVVMSFRRWMLNFVDSWSLRWKVDMKSDGDIEEDEVPRFCKLVCKLPNVIMTLAAALPNSSAAMEYSLSK
mmetsp:Transcript_4654/g.7191  ORF Transcript_4654/g.7191 Transcript_4654/m.7191 type:complete len:83 (+) Transcript_4654:55-303(+)